MLNLKLVKKLFLNPFIFFFVISVILISIWFRQGLVFGGGDVGLTTYNPSRIAEVISKVWWEDTAPGYPRPQGLASLPMELTLSVLQNIGFPPFAIQATLFGIILFSMGIGMYFLTLEMIGKDKKKIAYLAALFYLINPYMMVQVWHRFIHSTFFLAAGLPFLLFFWKRWIVRRDFWSLTFFILSNLIFSFMYSTFAYVVTVWIVLSYFVFFEAFIPWGGKRSFVFIFLNFLFGFSLWIFTNIWWIIPVLLISPSLLSAQHSIISNTSTLRAISNQTTILYTLAGLNPFYFFSQKELGEVFGSLLFRIIPWIYVTFIFLGMYSSIKKRSLIFLSGLFLIAIFFAKGIAMPFGVPLLLGFTKLIIIGVFRNPFEKIGILIPFAGSILFAVGFAQSWNFLKYKKIRIGLLLLMFLLSLVFGIYHWPFWSGTLFGTLDRPNVVEIPAYYSQANDWIKKQHKEGNILHLPVLLSEGLTYRWEYGYSGVDSSTDFFTSNPSISMGFNLFYIDNALGSLDLITEVTSQEDKIKSILRVLNVRFLVLHYDVNWQKSHTKNPIKVARKLDSLSFLIKQGNFGSLVIYEVKDEDYLSKLYTTGDADYLVGLNNDIPLFKNSWSWYARKDTSRLAISDDNLIQKESNKNKSVVISPNKVTNFYPFEELSPDDAAKRLPTVKVLPDSLFYILIRIKEKIQLLESSYVSSNLEFVFVGKRLVESYYLIKQNPTVLIAPTIKDYIKLLPVAMNKIDDIRNNQEVPIEIKNTLSKHLIILKALINLSQGKDKQIVIEANNLLRQLMTKQGTLTVYEQIFSSKNQAKQVLTYEVPKNGQYEILMTNSKAESIYMDSLKALDFQINEKQETRNAEKKSSFLSYGLAYLDKGEYEIGYPKINSVNLFKGFPGGVEEYEISSTDHVPKSFEVNVKPYDSGGTYAITFDFFVQKGNDPVVRIIQDSDPVDLIGFDPDGLQQRLYQYNQSVKEDTYNKYWRKFAFNLDSRENSSDLIFQIEVAPWNDCIPSLGNKKLCEKSEIRKNYERPTTIAIRNMKIYKVFVSPLFLRLKEEASPAAQISDIKYTKPKLLSYEGTFQINKPGYLVFSETFDKGWNLKLSQGSEVFELTTHVLANMYANAWYIEKAGQYQFKLEYKPQRYFNIGLYFGIISFVFILIISLFLYIKRIIKK